jgi:hypothetical protein
LLALDIVDGRHGFWQTMLVFVMHEIPVFVLIAARILAWQWEWIGAALYATAGLLYMGWVATVSHPIPPATRVVCAATITGPTFITAG